MNTETEPCRLCKELEQHLHSALRIDPPALLAGLSEAGKRNRTHQKQEKIAKAKLDLERHNKAVHPPS